ncbi:hypothetical protein FE257_004558 [Aspergillus nanangensis]|uniref:Uncharacterized protein n=1 Tax=Aspergillus nanangensis TaxID=2582783 RepID=A0AAD4CYQ6_ASPNN|nr:hypothetical protein FE257_004558 [Aspergillus nanangensis]
MSGHNDDRPSRWRGGRAFDQNRQSGQRHSNSRTVSVHSNSRGAQNAWTEPRENASTGPTQDQHVPVRGFNAAESKAALRRNPTEPKPLFYKPGGKDANNRQGGPWGSKPNAMANGKDFFLELRKQVTALRQGGNVAGVEAGIDRGDCSDTRFDDSSVPQWFFTLGDEGSHGRWPIERRVFDNTERKHNPAQSRWHIPAG